MGHCKVIERHVVFTNGVIYVRMKAEVVRCELVDLVVSDEGSGRLKWMGRKESSTVLGSREMSSAALTGVGR